MNEKEVISCKVEVESFNKDSANGDFLLKLIRAKIYNRAACEKQRIYVEDWMFKMTPQEELFAQYYNGEKTEIMLRVLAGQMDLLAVRAHREELSKIAFEARAKHAAAKDIERELEAKSKDKVKGFSSSLQTDEISTNAINTIKLRGQKLSKQEKLIAQMMKLPGVDRATAEKLVMAGTLKTELDKKFGKTGENEAKENLPFNNPFAPKPEKSVATATTDVNIIDESTIVIKETVTEIESEEQKPSFFNPFAK